MVLEILDLLRSDEDCDKFISSGIEDIVAYSSLATFLIKENKECMNGDIHTLEDIILCDNIDYMTNKAGLPVFISDGISFITYQYNRKGTLVFATTYDGNDENNNRFYEFLYNEEGEITTINSLSVMTNKSEMRHTTKKLY